MIMYVNTHTKKLAWLGGKIIVNFYLSCLWFSDFCNEDEKKKEKHYINQIFNKMYE